MSFLPGVLAHASQITYRFPLPTWIYIVAAGLIVLVSAPAAAAFMGRGPGLGWRSRNLYPRLRHLHLGAIGLTISSLLLVWCLLGGVAARTSEEAHEFLENPATILIWVDFWVGLGIVSALVGNIWDFVSPLSALARAIDRELGRREVGRRLYPERLGQWPAVALLLVWSWFELVWEPAKEPDKLALLVVGYFVLTLAGAGVFGADVWLANCEVFTVFARTLARCAPLELDPAEPEDWLDAEPTRRAVRLRPYGAGLVSTRPAPPGGGAFVIALLATVVYDGFSQTTQFRDSKFWIYDRAGFFRAHADLYSTLLMAAVVLAFVAAFLLVMAIVGRSEGGFQLTARRYAPTLVPIAAAYFVAHYFAYLLIAGKATLAVLVDPLGRSWNPWGLGEYPLTYGWIAGAGVWWAQIALIVVGHVAAILAAHHIAVQSRPTARGALLGQSPVVLLMVGYTMAGLWVLAQQLAPEF